GRATASEFARAGAAVALAARDATALAANVAAIQAASGVALACPCDVADEASVQEVFARVTAELGPVDILVNSAGAVAHARFEDMDAATWDHVLGVNLRGVFLCCREAFRQMIPRGGGVIVNLSSLSGVPNVEKFPGLSAYNVSKYGVAGLSEILAVEGRPHHIRVVTVSPGAVDTEMLRAAAPHLTPDMTPEELARILLFLVGPDARPLSGSNLVIFSNG
ncbi:MAG: SDR family oxidoreductase, partial [Chloroflexota bacterium]|nr:SDR family oxidoreductase [Chloroflexota bacterium]